MDDSRKKNKSKINVLMLKYEEEKRIEYAGHIAPGRARVSCTANPTIQCEMNANLWTQTNGTQTQTPHQFRIPDADCDDDNVNEDRRRDRQTHTHT